MYILFVFIFFFLMPRPPPRSTLFPYTTLFRSVLACDSTVTAENGSARAAIRGRSSGGTARRSKKLLALYSFSRSGNGPSTAASTCSSCLTSAPAGVGPSIVHRQRSQKEHVKGHSAPARKAVNAHSTFCSLGRRSCSTSQPCAVNGSTFGLGGRRPRMRRSTADALTRAWRAASRSAADSALHVAEKVETLLPATPSRAESVASGILACRCRARHEFRARPLRLSRRTR